ncbi:RNA-dependent RNA polymerase [Forsythia ovata]|uniref:RNA-dependent RNA polymerase n=1 Tax=Forsythia ovata TaxID=205694 RepID=A0ABD1TQ16_9LAMI
MAGQCHFISEVDSTKTRWRLLIGEDCSSQRISQISSSSIYTISDDLASGVSDVKTIEEMAESSKNCDDGCYPAEIETLVERKILFKVQIKVPNINEHNDLYTVMRLTDKSDLISKYGSRCSNENQESDVQSRLEQNDIVELKAQSLPVKSSHSTVTGSLEAMEGFSSTPHKPRIKLYYSSNKRNSFLESPISHFFCSFDDIISRPLESRNRVGDGTRVVLFAGMMIIGDCFGILESWDGVKLLCKFSKNVLNVIPMKTQWELKVHVIRLYEVLAYGTVDETFNLEFVCHDKESVFQLHLYLGRSSNHLGLIRCWAFQETIWV